MPDAAPTARGVYKPRRPQASPLFRVVSDHLQRLQTVYDERFAREYGPWRPVVAQVADKFLACGVLDHGFARIRCDACTHEYLLAFSCTCRYFCPSCHAKRLAIWTQWLDTTLLAPVPHRQVVLTIPKRLCAYCLYRRRLLGEIARVAARTVTAAIRTLTGEHDLAVGPPTPWGFWRGCCSISPTKGTSRRGIMAGMPTARAGCGVRASPPPLRCPPSSPRHDSRRPRPPADGRPFCSRLSRSTHSRARPAMAPCGSSRSLPRHQ